MKKLKLRALDFSAKELLSREQMKKVLGGVASGSGGSGADLCSHGGSCTFDGPGGKKENGTCEENSKGQCVCNAGDGQSIVTDDCGV